MSFKLPSGVHSLSIQITDSSDTSIQVPLGAVTVSPPVNLDGFLGEITENFTTSRDSVSLLEQLRLLLDSQLTVEQLNKIQNLLQLVILEFIAPDFEVIGPFLADLVTAVVCLLKEICDSPLSHTISSNPIQSALRLAPVQKRELDDFSVFIRAIDSLLCTLSFLVSSMTTTASETKRCFTQVVFFDLIHLSDLSQSKNQGHILPNDHWLGDHDFNQISIYK